MVPAKYNLREENQFLFCPGKVRIIAGKFSKFQKEIPILNLILPGETK